MIFSTKYSPPCLPPQAPSHGPTTTRRRIWRTSPRPRPLWRRRWGSTRSATAPLRPWRCFNSSSYFSTPPLMASSHPPDPTAPFFTTSETVTPSCLDTRSVFKYFFLFFCRFQNFTLYEITRKLIQANDASVEALLNGLTGSLGQSSNQPHHFHNPQVNFVIFISSCSICVDYNCSYVLTGYFDMESHFRPRNSAPRWINRRRAAARRRDSLGRGWEPEGDRQLTLTASLKEWVYCEVVLTTVQSYTRVPIQFQILVFSEINFSTNMSYWLYCLFKFLFGLKIKCGQLRRERIAERMKALQELVPNANKVVSF